MARIMNKRTTQQKVEATIIIMALIGIYFGGPALVFGLAGLALAAVILVIGLGLMCIGLIIYALIDAEDHR